MLSGISWMAYWVSLLTVLFLYYGFICWNYFSNKKKSGSRDTIIKGAALVSTDLTDTLQTLIRNAGQEGSPTTEILYGLQQALKNHPPIASPDRARIETVLQQSMSQIGRPSFQIEELTQLWCAFK